jgi:hypothetical protein
MWRAAVIAVGLAAAAVPAAAYSLTDPVPDDKLRPLCTDQPGFGVPPCIVDAGHVQFEMTALILGFDKADGVKTTTADIGTFLVRTGLTDGLEIDVGWTPLMVTTLHDGNYRYNQSETGDVAVALKQSLRDPDGQGVSVAVQAGLTIPTNGDRVSAVIDLPVSLPLSDRLTLGFTPALELLPDSYGGGTHFGAAGSVALGYQIGSVTLGTEVYITYEDEPDGVVQQQILNFAVIWVVRGNLEFDVGADVGLNADAPAAQVYFGISRRF